MSSDRCHIEPFVDYRHSIARALERVGALEVLARQRRILIKPNLVNASAYPVTVPLEASAALIGAIREVTNAPVVVAEGTGEAHLDTDEIFRIHGYETLVKEYGVTLLDLNEAPAKRYALPDAEVFPTMMLPEIIEESFIISFAMLKAHSLAGVTLCMKNMMGFPSHHYYQQGGHWKKSAFHARMHRSIFELNRYRAPDFSLIDASLGLSDYHLGGPCCSPPVKKIVAGFDPVAVDAAGAELLGHHWGDIEHIRLASGVLGYADTQALISDAASESENANRTAP